MALVGPQREDQEERRHSRLQLLFAASLVVSAFFAGALWGRQGWRERTQLFSASSASSSQQSIGPEWEQQCGGPLDVAHPIVEADGGPLCRAYRQVCFDQQTVISFDPGHSPGNATSEPIPTVPIEEIDYAWAGTSENGDRFHNSLFKYAPLVFRPAAALEPSPDLQQPSFSACTVPVVMWSMWTHVFEELLSHSVARVWGLQGDGAMSKASLLVVGTPAGKLRNSR
ncbi:hypothetical protein ABPG75_001812 [Micractinium tetrahymenae]